MNNEMEMNYEQKKRMLLFVVHRSSDTLIVTVADGRNFILWGIFD